MGDEPGLRPVVGHVLVDGVPPADVARDLQLVAALGQVGEDGDPLGHVLGRLRAAGVEAGLRVHPVGGAVGRELLLGRVSVTVE